MSEDKSSNGDNTDSACYHVNLELARGYVAKLKYLRREKDDDVKHRLAQALRLCKFDDGARSAVAREYPKKYKAHFIIPTAGFTDPGFRPGTLLDALRVWFGEAIKGDIKIVRSTEVTGADATQKEEAA